VKHALTRACVDVNGVSGVIDVKLIPRRQPLHERDTQYQDTVRFCRLAERR